MPATTVAYRESLIMDLEACLRERMDRDAIEALIYRYCDCFDRNDPEGVAALFTADAVIDYNPDTANIRGEALGEAVAIGLRETFAATSHHVSNVLIHFDSADRARSLSYVYAWHRYHDGSPDGQLWGRYRHRFSRGDGGWLISALTLEGAGTQNFHRARTHGIGRR